METLDDLCPRCQKPILEGQARHGGYRCHWNCLLPEEMADPFDSKPLEAEIKRVENKIKNLKAQLNAAEERTKR